MATGGQLDPLREELTCSICLDIYVNPVILTCNHSFCRVCIERTWKDSISGFYSCPQCRQHFRAKAFEKNFQLASIVQKYQSQGVSLCVRPDSNLAKEDLSSAETRIASSASRFYIQQRPHQKEVSSKSLTLMNPSQAVTVGTCTEHQEPLKVYCKNDKVCICSLCALVGGHKGHSIISISEGEKKLKKDLQSFQSMMRINIIALQSQMQVLQEQNKGTLKMMNKAKKDAVEKYKARKLQLEIEEKTALERLSREQNRIASMNDSRSLKLEKKMKELEDFLKELNTLSIDKGCTFIKRFHLVVDKMNTLAELLDDSKIEKMIEFPMDPSEFQRNRREMVRLYGHSPTLDPTTAHPSLFLFDNNTTVLGSFDAQRYPESEQRFDAKEQILGTQGVSYGRSYWEVKAEKMVGWKIGVCYVNMSRKGRGNECSLGQNDKSWCVQSGPFSFIAMHDRNKVKLNKVTGQSITVGVFVDLDCGVICFYNVSDGALMLLHTFRHTFTQPLYPALEITNKTVLTMLSMEHC